MENSVGKITWGYIWRLFLWIIATGIFFTFILRSFLGAGISNIDSFDADALSKAVSSMKIYIIGFVICNILAMILSCRFAVSGIRKKFNIDDSNRQQVIRNIIIILVACAVFLLVYNISNLSTITEVYEDMEEEISDVRSIAITDEEDEMIEEVASLVSVSKVAVAVIIISNVVVIIGMIPFVKKWLNTQTA